MKWKVYNYHEAAEGGDPQGFIVEAETREEAIQKAPHDWKDPNRNYFSAHKIEEADNPSYLWDEFMKVRKEAYLFVEGKMPIRTIAIDFADFVLSKEEGE